VSDSTENQVKGVRKTSPWPTRLIIVLFILLIISAGANYFFIPSYFENQEKIERLEKDVRSWEASFRHFYFYANRDWPEAERYALGILIKAFSAKLTEERGWSVKEQTDWEADPEKGEAYVKKILK
jgi:hypothetical protein